MNIELCWWPHDWRPRLPSDGKDYLHGSQPNIYYSLFQSKPPVQADVQPHVVSSSKIPRLRYFILGSAIRDPSPGFACLHCIKTGLYDFKCKICASVFKMKGALPVSCKFDGLFYYMGGNFISTTSMSARGRHYVHEQVRRIAGVCRCDSTSAKR